MSGDRARGTPLRLFVASMCARGAISNTTAGSCGGMVTTIIWHHSVIISFRNVAISQYTILILHGLRNRLSMAFYTAWPYFQIKQLACSRAVTTCDTFIVSYYTGDIVTHLTKYGSTIFRNKNDITSTILFNLLTSSKCMLQIDST